MLKNETWLRKNDNGSSDRIKVITKDTSGNVYYKLALGENRWLTEEEILAVYTPLEEVE